MTKLISNNRHARETIVNSQKECLSNHSLEFLVFKEITQIIKDFNSLGKKVNLVKQRAQQFA